MNAHALGILEFPRLLAHVAGRALSTPGAAAVRALTPRVDRVWIEREHGRVEALRSLISSDLGWPSEPIPDLGESLSRLRIAGLSWSAAELSQAATLLASSRRIRETLRDPRRPAVVVAFLSQHAARLVDLRAIEAAIARAIADDGSVRDDASPALRTVRRELRRTEGELVRLLEREMARLEVHHQVSDGSVTMRNGRWVMPVRRGARVVVGGIVHDSSGTGETIFVEPPAAVEYGNRVRELEMEEQREVERVLRELTESLRPSQPQIIDAFHALVALDSLAARARYAIEAACAALAFCAPADGLAIVDGRHPLLLARGERVVPFDLTLEASERTMLVSGPNTGGKTVLLKAIGLMCAMAQSGVPTPVGATSRLPVFDDMFADVGDEQSIEASLSTFSAHVKNLGEILAGATGASLVLADELGSGTDPAEGAALGGAILEALTRRGTMTIATTHLGQLKLLATEVPGVINASLQFDAVELRPTYRLLKGVPGRSYGISIARRLALPEDVLQQAEARLPVGERDLAILLADFERREAELTERERLAAIEQRKVNSRVATVSDRELKLRERERDAERNARKSSRQYLLDARAELERAIAEVREHDAGAARGGGRAGVSAERGGEPPPASFDDTARAARRRLETAAASAGDAAEQAALVGKRELERRVRQLEANAAEGKSAGAESDSARRDPGGDARRGGAPDASATPTRRDGAPAEHGAARRAPKLRQGPLVAGDAVLLGTLDGKTGRLLSVRGDDARVAVGSLTLTVPMASLVRTAPPPPPAVKVSLGGSVPEAEIVREVDVRGMRGDDIDDEVIRALDAAIRAELRELRIIHGKGTGALRARVGEMLRKDTRIAGFRLGAWNEGGAGVTVAELA